MYLLKSSNDASRILTLVFASLFLVSLGMISHNAFADNVVATIQVGGSGSLGQIATNPNTNKIYVTNSASNSVSVIDGSTNTVVNNIAAGQSPLGIAVNPNTNRIYVANFILNQGTVTVIDGSTNTVLTTISVGSDPDSVAVNPNTNMVYVSNFDSSTVSVINGSTNTVVNTTTVGDHPVGVAVDPNTNRIYVSNNISYNVSVIDGSTNSVVATIPIGGPGDINAHHLRGIAVNPNTNKTYVINYESEGVSVIDDTNNSVLTTVPTGSNPIYVGVNPNTNKIYVTNSASNSVSVIDGSTNKVLRTIFVGFIPQGVGVDPNTNMIYVDNYDGIVTVIDGSTTIPSPPQNLQAISNIAQVSLSWSAPSSNGGSPITNYNIYQGISSGSEKLLVTAGNVTSYTDYGVTNGQTYFYKVTAVNPAGESTPSNEVSATMPNASGDSVIATVHVGNTPNGVAVNPITNMIYVINNTSVFVINGTTNTLVNTIATGETSGFIPDIGANPNTNRIYVANYVNNTVSVIDGSTDSIVDKIPVTYPIGVQVNPATNMVYVINGGYLVTVINGSTNAIVTQISVPGSGGVGPQGIVVNANTNKIYVSSTGYAGGPRGYLSIIDGASNSLLTSIKVGVIGGTLGVNPNVNRIYMTGSDGILFVIDGSTNHIIGKIAGFDRAAGIGVDPETDKIYLANYGSNIVSVIDGQTNTITNQVQVGSGPLGVGVDAATNKIYVANSGNATVSVIDGSTFSATNTSDIALNNVQSTSGTTDPSNQIILSNFNATAGKDRLLVVGVSANSNNVGSITFAGVPLAREVSHFTNNDAEFWYLTNPAGTGDITVTMNGPTQAVVGAYSFSGVNQTAPIPTHITRHNLAPSSPAISITTQYPNDWVLDLPSIYGGSTLGLPTCTQQWDVNVPNTITGASSSMIVPSPAIVTCGWTASSDDMWDNAAIEIRAAG